MGWETDSLPMTPEKYIKPKAHSYIMKFNNLGISFSLSKLAAVAMVIELEEQFLKRAGLTDKERQNASANFEKLRKAITAF